MPLTEVACRQAKPRDKDYKLFDRDGLYLLIRTSGTKSWRVKLHVQGKEKHLTLGTYPELGLAKAREKTAAARSELANGGDPVAAKQEAKRKALNEASGTFASISNTWLKAWGEKVSESSKSQIKAVLDNHLLPKLGNRQMSTIEPPDLLRELERIEKNAGNEQAHRALRATRGVFKQALVMGLVTRNPANDLSGVLPPIKNGHYRSITNPDELAAALVNLWHYTNLNRPGRGPTPSTAMALRLGPYVALRPGELIEIRWSWLNADKKTLLIPAQITKKRRDLIVPLSYQALEIIEFMRPITGHNERVFAGRCGNPLSGNTLNFGLRAAGIGDQIVAHGWRAAFRTLAHEELEFDPYAIEHQLAHKIANNGLGQAYDRTMFIKQRVELMQKWADYIDKLRTNAKSNNENPAH